jgi:predicted  nucleic acid-binding Zn-ribbon protein
MSPVEERVASLETNVEHLKEDISEIRSDVKEVHSRITTTTREIVDKIDAATASIKHDATTQHQSLSDQMGKIDSRVGMLERWRFMIIGGAIVFGYLIGHLDFFTKFIN